MAADRARDCSAARATQECRGLRLVAPRPATIGEAVRMSREARDFRRVAAHAHPTAPASPPQSLVELRYPGAGAGGAAGVAGGNHGGCAGGIGILDESHSASSAWLMRGNSHASLGGEPGGCGVAPKGATVWSQNGLNSSRGSVILHSPWSSKPLSGISSEYVT
jgi:hypothetical protein